MTHSSSPVGAAVLPADNHVPASESHNGDGSRQHREPGKFVCGNCLEDEGLKKFAREHAKIGVCSYCGTRFGKTDIVYFRDVINYMRRCIHRQWCNPADEDFPPEDYEEYLSQVHDAAKLFQIIDFEVSKTSLMSDFISAFNSHEWRRKPGCLLTSTSKWANGWDAFKRCVKHERRFTFWHVQESAGKRTDTDVVGPDRMLYELKTLLRKIALITTIPCNKSIWRIQVFDSSARPDIPSRFTSPPLRRALRPNRMSPAGIPMFYGAEDFETGCRELVNPHHPELSDKVAIGVRFRTLKPLHLLDLMKIPSKKSVFLRPDPTQDGINDFLRAFGEDLSMPIKDGRQLIDYVPTQVFTEFVRYMMRGPKGVKIDGIRYSSSRTQRPCWVLFATQAECLEEEALSRLGLVRQTPQKLQYIHSSVRTALLPWTRGTSPSLQPYEPHQQANFPKLVSITENRPISPSKNQLPLP